MLLNISKFEWLKAVCLLHAIMSHCIEGMEGGRSEDTVVASVVASFLERSRAGQLKYGTTLDRTDLSPMQWAQHMQEELMDAILYLERLKREMSQRK
jgi:hypothetical protein